MCAAEWTGQSKNITVQSKNITVLRAVTYLSNLARSHAGRKQSLRELAQALRLEPSNADNWFELGKLRLALDDPKRALAAFDAANCEGERPLYWVWIAYTRRLMDRKDDAAQEAWKWAKEFVNDDLFQNNGIEEVWTVFRNVIGFGHLPLPDLQDWEAESRQLVKELKELNVAGRDIIDKNTPWDLVKKLTGQSDAADTPDETDRLIRLVDWVNAHDSEMKARQLRPFVVERAETERLRRRSSSSSRRTSTVRSGCWRTLSGPGPSARTKGYCLSGHIVLLNLLELATDEVSNALSLDPGNEVIKELAVEVAQRIFDTVTDRQVRCAALRRMMLAFGDLAAGARGGLWTVNLLRIGWPHFWLARIALELLDVTTAQKGFETSFGCRFKPFESLANLCLVHYRFDAFEEAEKVYHRLYTHVSIVKPKEARLRPTDELDKLGEEHSPDFWLAWASKRTPLRQWRNRDWCPKLSSAGIPLES